MLLFLIVLMFVVYAHGRRLFVVIGIDMKVQPLVTHNAAGPFCVSVVVTSPKLTLMATLIGEVHSNFGIPNSVCRLLRIFIAQNINIVY